jgi:hypothetical protein
MNGESIASILAADRAAGRTFLGVFARDNIPNLPRHAKRYPLSLVVNTDKLDESGEHWVAAYYTSPNAGEFFDSYGHAPSALGFTRKMLPGIKCWNTSRLQSLHSSACGHYCVYFVAMRARGERGSAWIFSRRRGFREEFPQRNDAIVRHFFQNRTSSDSRVSPAS